MAHAKCLRSISPLSIIYRGPGSSVGIATGYGLDGPGMESRWRARFPAPFQTGPVAHTASCTMGTASFPGIKSGRGVTLTPHHLLVPWSRKTRAIPLLPLWAVRHEQNLSACTRVHYYLLLFITKALRHKPEGRGFDSRGCHWNFSFT